MRTVRDEDLRVSELVLERARVAARARVGSYTAQSMEVRSWASQMMDGLVYELTAEVLRDRVGEQHEDVEWNGKVRVEVPTEPWPAPRGWGMLVGVAVGWIVAGALLGGAAAAFGIGALVAVILLRLLNRPGEPGAFETKVPVGGTVRVTATAWNSFPRAAIAYPPELGAAVRMVSFESEPSIRQERP